MLWIFNRPVANSFIIGIFIVAAKPKPPKTSKFSADAKGMFEIMPYNNIRGNSISFVCVQLYQSTLQFVNKRKLRDSERPFFSLLRYLLRTPSRNLRCGRLVRHLEEVSSWNSMI